MFDGDAVHRTKATCVIEWINVTVQNVYVNVNVFSLHVVHL